MKALDIIKYVFKSASYGVFIAVLLLLFFPKLAGNVDVFSALTKADGNGQPLSYAKGVSVASPAVVNIYSKDFQSSSAFTTRARNVQRLGSGVIMDQAGFILTNFHVVQGADQIVVVLQTGQQFPAELIGYDYLTDLAVLKVAATNLPVIPQNLALQSRVGDVVLAIGNPLDLGQTVTQGVISATGRNGLSSNYSEFLQMDAAINEGNSGGALINTNGELVGINSSKFKQNNRLNPVQGIFLPFLMNLHIK